MTTLVATDEEGSPAKRQKLDVTNLVSSHILRDEPEYKSRYASAKPFRHCVYDDVLDREFVLRVQKEVKDNSKVNFKESDLFRVYQSIDLANLDESHNETMPALMNLRQILYSDEWRSLMERVCGLKEGTLSKQVDCAFNCHTPGCHLLCHDDVIGTRKVSYILYLPDPVPDWQRKEGGALELYDSYLDPKTQQRCPELFPSVFLTPTFNSMAFFQVEPGVSFHAVQEVTGDRPRLSLQGWYHGAMPPDNIQEATLQRLKTLGGNPDSEEYTAYPAHTRPSPSSSRNMFKEEDRIYLSKYLQSAYLTPLAIKDMRERFQEDSSIQLRNFFQESVIQCLRPAMEDEDSNRLTIDDPGFYQQGLSESWKLQGPTHMQRLAVYRDRGKRNGGGDSVGELLQGLRTNVLESEAFRHYLAQITNLGLPLGYRGEIRRFLPGRDYTVAHYGVLTEKSVLDATMCFVAGRGSDVPTDEDEQTNGQQEPDEADIAWQLGDAGGFECYIEADDDKGEAADEYSADDDTPLLSVSACNNTLSLVFRDPGTMRFVKYVSAGAPSSRFDIAFEYKVEDVAETDDEHGD